MPPTKSIRRTVPAFTPTDAEPGPLPRLTDDPGYAAAAGRRAELQTGLAAARADLQFVLDVRAAGHAPGRTPSVARAAAAILAGDDIPADAGADSPQAVLARLTQAEARVHAYTLALEHFDRETLHPARAAARPALLARAFADHWRPAMREVAAAFLDYHRAMLKAQAMGEALSDGGLFAGPIGYPLPNADQADQAERRQAITAAAKDLVAAGYFDADELAVRPAD